MILKIKQWLWRRKQLKYEAERRAWFKDHPNLTREAIEANTPEPKLMTAQEIIDAGAKLIVKG